MVHKTSSNRRGLAVLGIGIALLGGCGVAAENDAGTQEERRSSVGAQLEGCSPGYLDLVHVDFDGDTPGTPPLTGGEGQPTSLVTSPGASAVVEASAIGIASQPLVLTAQGPSQFVGVMATFEPVGEGSVRVEATVALDRLADGMFLDTSAGSGPVPSAGVTRLRVSSAGEVQDEKTLTVVGRYTPNRPFGVRMDIDMSAKTWSVTIDADGNGFDDDPVTSGLPFLNAVDVTPTVGAVWATFSLFPTASVAPTRLAYDNVRVSRVLPITLSVRTAQVVQNRSTTGTVHLTADYCSTPPRPGDQIRMTLDGALLLDEPFSAFSRFGRGQTYWLLRKGLLAWIDLGAGSISIVASQVNLAPLDPSDGVGVSLRIGSAAGSEIIPMVQLRNRWLWYSRAPL